MKKSRNEIRELREAAERGESEAMLDYLRAAAGQADIVTSVCSGSALLAKAGLLDGLQATTNKQFFQLARMQSDKVDWVEAARWVDAGKFVTSSGVSAGMDMTLAVIARVWGEESAEYAARFAEYTWHRDPAEDPFVEDLDVEAIPGVVLFRRSPDDAVGGGALVVERELDRDGRRVDRVGPTGFAGAAPP